MLQILIRTLLLGIVSGSVYALASTGLVLTYKTSGVLNFGYGAVALFTSFCYWQMTVRWGWPVWPAALVVLFVVAPLLGVFLDTQLFRRIEGQPQIIGVIATVGLFVLLQGVVVLVWGGETRSVPGLFPHGTVAIPGGANIGKDQLGVLVVAAAAAAGLGAMLRYTRLGIAFRAVVNNRSVAGLMAVNTGFISSLAWALSTSFAALTGILLTPRLLLSPEYIPPLIIAFVLGAASVGRMQSLPKAYMGGLIIGIAQALFIQYIQPRSHNFILQKLSDSIPFLIITGAVLAAPKALRAAGGGASFVVRTREVVERASPRARLATAAATVFVIAAIPILTGGSASWEIQMSIGMAYAIVFLSLVILTGYSGQISLGHTAFMGISAFTAAHVANDLHVPMVIALLVGALAAVPAGALIGFVAVRVHGIFLALMTLAFAFMAQSLFFESKAVSGGEGGVALNRPHLIQGYGAFYYFVLAALVLCVVFAVNLRTGRTGRILAGMRDSETACRALGIPVTRYKLRVFGLSAFMAGVGAILLAMVREQATSRDFIPFYSLIYMALAVLGGIFHVGGAVVAGLFFGVYPKLTEIGFLHIGEFLSRVQLILFGLGATLALAQNPEGLFGELRRAGNALLRVWYRRGGVAPPPEPAPAPVAGGGR
jgi:branched-subunit amino acid ABC-type transport system permease component